MTCYDCIYCDDRDDRCERTGEPVDACDPEYCDIGIEIGGEDE